MQRCWTVRFKKGERQLYTHIYTSTRERLFYMYELRRDTRACALSLSLSFVYTHTLKGVL